MSERVQDEYVDDYTRQQRGGPRYQARASEGPGCSDLPYRPERLPDLSHPSAHAAVYEWQATGTRRFIGHARSATDALLLAMELNRLAAEAGGPQGGEDGHG